VSSQHNVCEVSESTYRSCDDTGGNGVRVRYTSGYDRVVLAEARTYWFICDFPGHCLGGMKLAVNVSLAATGSPSSSPNYGSNAAASSPPAGKGRRSSLAWALALGVVVSM
jgi:hypothetical protein